MQLFLQVTHVRSLHATGFAQQQEAMAVETEPATFSVFRTQQNDPVSKSLAGQMLSVTSENTIHLPLDGTFVLVLSFCLFVCNFSVNVHWFLFPGIPVWKNYWPVLHSSLCPHSQAIPSWPSPALPATGWRFSYESKHRIQNFGHWFSYQIYICQQEQLSLIECNFRWRHSMKPV